MLVLFAPADAHAAAAAQDESAATSGAHSPPADAESENALSLLPVELTAFGDIQYRITDPGHNQFQLGSVELDPSLSLSEHVLTSAALAYDPDGDVFRLAAFTVDSSLAGPESKHLFKTHLLLDSGIVFGKFDVPFGIAYLQYASTDNRFVELPAAVTATHAAWNDIGAQVYALTESFEATAYLVNGTAFSPEPTDTAANSFAVGGRLGVRPISDLSVGTSAASVQTTDSTGLFGADLSADAGPFELRNEYIYFAPADQVSTQGFYSQGIAHVDRFFAGARWETIVANSDAAQSSLGLTLGAEVFTRAEVRLAHQRNLDGDGETTFIQLVGGSSWQPTGLRR